MPSLIVRFSLALVVTAALCLTAFAQTRPPRPKPRATPMPEVPRPDEVVPAEPQDIDTLKTDTNLVIVPVIASDRAGSYIGDLAKEEFEIVEDGVKQEIAFFAQVSVPFHVVLMLDTSASTEDKLNQIQRAAFAFVQQLQNADRVKVISFDDQVRDLNVLVFQLLAELVDVRLAATTNTGHADSDHIVGTDHSARGLGAGDREQAKCGAGRGGRLNELTAGDSSHGNCAPGAGVMVGGDSIVMPRAVAIQPKLSSPGRQVKLPPFTLMSQL